MAPRLRKPASQTIGAEIDAASAVLREAGVTDAESLALSTWAALAGTAPGAVWMNRDEAPLSEDLPPRFHDVIARHAAGVPVQYAVGRAGFRLVDLFVDRRVLIPRSETEGLVEHVLAFGRGRAGANGGGSWGVAADIGTGSGAIALSLASEGSFECVIATDASAEALEVARLNHATLRPTTRVDFRHGSLLEPLENTKVDVIVSNPPYVSTPEWRGLPGMVRDFEPRLALDGGPDGLTYTREILEGAAAHLASGGLLALEIDSSRGAQTLDLALTCGWRGRVLPDASGRDRYFLATRELD